MIKAQSILLKENEVLMVKQMVTSKMSVWSFPGGRANLHETPEQACIRETKEETGYDVNVVKLIDIRNSTFLVDKGDGTTNNCLVTSDNVKYTFLAKIVGGDLFLDKKHPGNDKLIELAWVDLMDDSYFDEVTLPIRNIILRNSK